MCACVCMCRNEGICIASLYSYPSSCHPRILPTLLLSSPRLSYLLVSLHPLHVKALASQVCSPGLLRLAGLQPWPLASMPTLNNQVNLSYNPSGWTEREFAIGATSSQQKERQRVYRQTQQKIVEDKLRKKAGLRQLRKEKQAEADQKRREETERSLMAEEDHQSWLCRCRNWKTPNQNHRDWVDRALAMPVPPEYWESMSLR